MENLVITETFINATKDYVFGRNGMMETSYTNRGELFRALKREYGRCKSKVYEETRHGIEDRGWVFEARMRYEDSEETYLREVWVSVF